MLSSFKSDRFRELVRYYQVGVLNTLFGLGAYALLVRLGMGIYGAQLLSHLMGMAFNYITYSRHVFRDAGPAKTRFVISYAVNYLLGVSVLAALAQVILSPYAVGIGSAIIVSAINYFALRFFVFESETP